VVDDHIMFVRHSTMMIRPNEKSSICTITCPKSYACKRSRALVGLHGFVDMDR
jgi:hypothetical protein